MLKYLQPLLIIIAALTLSCSNTAQPSETNKYIQPPAATTTEPARPADASQVKTSVQASHDIAPALTIKSVKVTSPNRKDVIILPANDNKTVSGRIWETLDLECIAADQAEHSISYAWSCSAGKVRGEGSKVVWTAPGAGGDYTVTVNVSCDKGEKTALTIDMKVKCCGD